MNLIYTVELPTEDDIFSFYEEMGWNGFLKLSSVKLLSAMRQSYFSVYVYDEGKLIAAGRVVSDGIISAYICGLGVLPNYRRQGIGTEIMRRLTAHCTERNLHVQFFCEDDLIPYYNKMGFGKFAVGMKLQV